MKFLRTLLAVIVGLFVFSALIFFIFLGIISAASTERMVEIKDNSVLHLIIRGNLVEREMEDPLSKLTIPGSGMMEMGIKEVKEAIRHASSDEKIKGIYLEPRYFNAGFASLDEIRNELISFKDSGKFVMAYSEFYTEKGYYLASVADEVFLTPDYGNLEFNGLNMEVTFFKGTLEKLKIEPQIFRVGEYKSAVEPFIREDLSEANEEQLASFMNSIYDHQLTRIAESRGLDFDRIKLISDSMLVRSPEDAVELQLVNDLAYGDEINDLLREKLALDEEEDINLVTYRKYNKSYTSSKYAKDRIAVIIGTGGITTGEGDDRNIGSEKYVELIRDARTSDRVKAIVMRINSGGGSALASDVMWNEVRLATKEKPVIASLSDVAASGGYYMAMGCDTIVASPTTITGSIGIFGMLINMKEFMNDKLGITFDNVKTGRFSDIYTITRPLTPYEKQIIQNSVEEGYDTFTSKAADSRGMPLDQLLELASGRIWSGSQAKENGLIDVFGSLEDAITIAAEAAGIEEYRTLYYPEQKTFFEQLMTDLSEGMQARIMKIKMGELYPYLEDIKRIEQLQGIQARMPYRLEMN